MPNMAEILNQISAEVSRNDHDPFLDIRNRPRLRLRTKETINRNQQTLQIYSDSRKYERLPPMPEGILRPSRHTKHFPRENWRTLGHQTPVWFDDIIIVTRGTKKEHTRKYHSVLSNLENEGNRASKKKSKYNKKKQYGSDTQYHKMASHQTKKKQTQ